MTHTHEHLTIGGHWIGGSVVPADAMTDVVSPVTGDLVAAVPSGTAADIDRAVETARAALPAWAATPSSERADVLRRLSAEIAARTEDIAQAITAEIGAPITFSRLGQAGFPALVATATADLEPSIEWSERAGNSLIVREPVGVVGAITPWNFPLQQVMTKIAPAL